jgi:hypothetical protein
MSVPVRSCFLLALVACAFTLAEEARAEGEAVTFLEPGTPRLTILRSEEPSKWGCRTITPSIVWFFASTSTSEASLTFDHQERKPSNPLWLRTGSGYAEAVAGLTITSRDSAVRSRVWIEAEAEFDPSEPNDHFAEAKPLDASGEAKFFLYPKLDQDWFSITVGPEEKETALELFAPKDGSQPFRDGIELGVCDGRERPLVQRVGTPAPNGLWKPIPFELAPGDYRCWVRARGDRASRAALRIKRVLPSAPPTPPVALQPVSIVNAAAGPAKQFPPGASLSRGSTNDPPPLPPLVATAEKPAPPRGGFAGWWILLSLAVLFALWLGPVLLRPRRVFDLTR